MTNIYEEVFNSVYDSYKEGSFTGEVTALQHAICDYLATQALYYANDCDRESDIQFTRARLAVLELMQERETERLALLMKEQGVLN